jgi:hypothetical protein
MVKPVPIFISYSHKDKIHLEEFLKFLKPDMSAKRISVWTDNDILAGQPWDKTIKDNLNKSAIILFLVSQDFMASNYINAVEISTALQNNQIVSIPVIIRPALLNKSALNVYQVVPTGAKPISDWDPQDAGWIDVIAALDKVIDSINGLTVNCSESYQYAQTTYAASLKKVNTTDRLFMLLMLILFTGGLITFAAGIGLERWFYIYTAMLAMGISFVCYFLSKRLNFFG